jgi:hypothetical protein
MNDEILKLIKVLGGCVKFDTPVRCKMSPHQHPEKLTEITLDTDLDQFSHNMKLTIIQRLKTIIYESSKN